MNQFMHNKVFNSWITWFVSYNMNFSVIIFCKLKFCSSWNFFILNNVNFSVTFKFKFMSVFSEYFFASIGCNYFFAISKLVLQSFDKEHLYFYSA
jgi:hypothetical protein